MTSPDALHQRRGETLDLFVELEGAMDLVVLTMFEIPEPKQRQFIAKVLVNLDTRAKREIVKAARLIADKSASADVLREGDSVRGRSLHAEIEQLAMFRNKLAHGQIGPDIDWLLRDTAVWVGHPDDVPYTLRGVGRGGGFYSKQLSPDVFDTMASRLVQATLDLRSLAYALTSTAEMKSGEAP